MHFIVKALAIGFGAALLTGCAQAPRGAAMQKDILNEASAEAQNYQIVLVNGDAVTKSVANWPATGTGIGLNWPEKGQAQRSRALSNGDKISLLIWDNQPNSLISSNEQRAVPMSNLEISPDGTIFVPYVEEVKVAGLSPEAARLEIQNRLTAIAPSAQVQLAVAEGDQKSIDLVAGVSRPGRYPVAGRGVTILSMLAEAGGIPDSMRNPVVRLQRAGTSYAALARSLYSNPARDVMLRAGDRIMVESDPRSFVVLGAAGAERKVAFENASHSLLEGLSLSSGLAENRADLRAILVLRHYGDKSLRKDPQGPNKNNVVFAFDLSSGAGLFAARQFDIHPDDIVLATESPLPPTNSILGLFGSTLGLYQRLD